MIPHVHFAGEGAFAKEDISKGTVFCVYSGHLMNEDENLSHNEHIHDKRIKNRLGRNHPCERRRDPPDRESNASQTAKCQMHLAIESLRRQKSEAAARSHGLGCRPWRTGGAGA